MRRYDAKFKVPVQPMKNSKKVSIVLSKLDLIIMYAIIRNIDDTIGNNQIICVEDNNLAKNPVDPSTLLVSFFNEYWSNDPTLPM